MSGFGRSFYLLEKPMNVLIVGTPTCSYCDRAKALCTDKNIPYAYHELFKDISRDQLEEMVGRPVKTVPQVFSLDEEGRHTYIGGFAELQSLVSTMQQ